MRTLTICLILTGLTLAPTALFADEPSEKTIIPDVVYGHKDGLAMTFDVHRPTKEPNGAAVLFMMSGGWVSRWAPPERTRGLFQPYLEAGYTVFAVRHGSSPKYGIPDAVSDVRRAVRFVRKNAKRFGIDADRMGAMGMSAGGHLALMLGTTGDDGNPKSRDDLDKTPSRVAAVVALVPPTDLRVAIWSAPESLPAYKNFPALDLSKEKAAKHSPLLHVTSDDAPSLVIMGGKDTLVPPKHGKWIEEKFREKKVKHKVLIFEGAGHGLEGAENRARMVRESVGWFDAHLGKK